MPYKDIDKRRLYNKRYQKGHYSRNKQYYIDKEHDKRREIKQWLDNLKSTLHCIRCGEEDSICLDFHHRNPTEKDMDISRAINRGWSIKRILSEIEKCDVLCSNCHRKEHGKIKLN